MRRVALLLFTMALIGAAYFFSSSPAEAQTTVPCSGGSGCPERYYFETQPCDTGVCNRSTPPLYTEFQAGKGMSLSGLAAYTLEVCAASGQKLSGTGKIRVYLWSPWETGEVASSSDLEWNVATNYIATACYGTLVDGGGPGAIACRCRYMATPVNLYGFTNRRAMAGADTIATSGGAAVSVRLIGLKPVGQR